MDLRQIDAIAQQTMAGRISHATREPGWLYYHGRRTGKLALWLADRLELDVDRTLLYVGALFHDVGKGEPSHAERGAVRAATLLAPYCPPDELAIICELVRRHDRRGDPAAPPMLRMLQDADILDHVGPLGTWLAFYWSGTRGETVGEHRDYIEGDENRRYRSGMRAKLNYEAARQEFDRRIVYEDLFFATFHRVYTDGVWPRDEV